MESYVDDQVIVFKVIAAILLNFMGPNEFELSHDLLNYRGMWIDWIQG